MIIPFGDPKKAAELLLKLYDNRSTILIKEINYSMLQNFLREEMCRYARRVI